MSQIRGGILKTDKYIITEYKPKNELPQYRRAGATFPEGYKKSIVWLDEEVVSGAFYVECVWYFKSHEEFEVDIHTHDFDEVIGFFGSNPDDVTDLCGEVEYWIDGEKHVINKSCLIYIPKGTRHCPQRLIRVERPIFHFTAGTGGIYD